MMGKPDVIEHSLANTCNNDYALTQCLDMVKDPDFWKTLAPNLADKIDYTIFNDDSFAQIFEESIRNFLQLNNEDRNELLKKIQSIL